MKRCAYQGTAQEDSGKSARSTTAGYVSDVIEARKLRKQELYLK